MLAKFHDNRMNILVIIRKSMQYKSDRFKVAFTLGIQMNQKELTKTFIMI